MIAILEVVSGTAEIDLDGDAETDTELDAVGLDLETRAALASTYESGAELCYALRTHLSPSDWNTPNRPLLPFCPPAECPGARQPIAQNDLDNPACVEGSIIECENQILREDIPVHGTPFSLHYASDRVPGGSSVRQLSLPLTGTSTPSVVSVEATFTVAGRRYHHEQACPCPPNANWSSSGTARTSSVAPFKGRSSPTISSPITTRKRG